MWYAASNQNSPAVYLLLFGLTAVFLVSIPHTLLNLADVTIAPESAKPAFAGEEISLPVEIMNCSRTTRRGIELVLPGSGGERKRVDYIPAGKAARVTLRFPAGRRGERRVGTFRLTSIYPLGFARVLKRFASSQTYLEYPKPSGDPRLPSHRARCWRGAFSSMLARVEFVPRRRKSMSTSKSSRRTQPWRDTAIPRRPLLWLAAALLFTLPPMFGNLASWVPFLFLLALVLKFWMEPRGYRLRSTILKLILAAVTVGAIFLSYQTLTGIEPSVSLLAVLVSLKILEAHTARE